MRKTKMRVIFMGTPDFAVGTLNALVEDVYKRQVLEVRAQIPETAKGTLTNKLTAMAVNPESPEETLVREACLLYTSWSMIPWRFGLHRSVWLRRP